MTADLYSNWIATELHCRIAPNMSVRKNVTFIPFQIPFFKTRFSQPTLDRAHPSTTFLILLLNKHFI